MTRSTKICLLIIIVLLGSNAWWIKHGYQHKTAGDHYIGHVKKYPLLDPALPFFQKEDLIVNVQDLRQYLRSLPEQNKDWASMTIYFEVLNTGANISVNPDLQILPASLTKLPLGMIAMKKVEKGEWTIDKEFTVLPKDIDTTSVSKEPLISGKNYSVETLLEKMLQESDNTAFNIFNRNITREEYDSITENIGLDQLFTREGKISAKEYSRLLRSLYYSSYLNEQYSQRLLEMLANSSIQELLVKGLPDGVKFAHKWGINGQEKVFSDSGIVYLENRPYLISVMVQGHDANPESDHQRVKKLMEDISKQAYSYMKGK